MIANNKTMVDDLKIPIILYLKHLKIKIFKGYTEDLHEHSHSHHDPEKIKKVLNMSLEEFSNIENLLKNGFLIKEDPEEEALNIKYDTIDAVDKELNNIEQLMCVSNLNNKFNSKEIQILDHYFGLSGKRKYLDDISKIINIPMEELKNLLEKLVIKLKYNGKREWNNEN
jgi:hypothetical protein